MGLVGTVNHTLTRWARGLMRDNRVLVRGYFEHIYRKHDPYGTITDPLSEQKRDDIIDAVAGHGFERALEIGCGEGTLALRLADHVGTLTMLDISERALRRARKRLADKSNVRMARHDFVSEPLPAGFDLVVCQESLVYARPEDLPGVRDKILGALDDGGTLVLLHPRSIHDDDSGLEYKDIGARTVHEVFVSDPRVRMVADKSHEMYRITILTKAGTTVEAV